MASTGVVAYWSHILRHGGECPKSHALPLTDIEGTP